ncbi:MAG TPA: arsinothricin resistance N-acetyltransferase ArsN1 family A [Candidatus Limnocylindria bacterium]|nr:arsinothricin resistance N-acetyltransferase ArsN1 family A [Candidatus Limnocylindria bacterium]
MATRADAAAIARIHNDGIADRVATFETEPRTAEDVARLLTERGSRWPTVVVERDGAVIAWAGASEYRPRECYAGVAEFSVYVARDARGTGAGRAAMEALVATCEGRGMWKLVSRVFPENDASRRLLAGVGFREVGTYHRHGKLDGEWRDTVIVERLIGEAAG